MEEITTAEAIYALWTRADSVDDARLLLSVIYSFYSDLEKVPQEKARKNNARVKKTEIYTFWDGSKIEVSWLVSGEHYIFRLIGD